MTESRSKTIASAKTRKNIAIHVSADKDGCRNNDRSIVVGGLNENIAPRSPRASGAPTCST